MRLRSLLAVTAATTMLGPGVTSTAAWADPVLSPAMSGAVVVWGESGDPAAGPAIAVPADLTTFVADVAVSDKATAVVTADGRLRVWGEGGAGEVTQAPTDVTDAIFVAISAGSGAVIRKDGSLKAWGSPALEAVPRDVNDPFGVISLAGGTGYYVKQSGATVGSWGADPGFNMPNVSGGALDISAGPSQVLVLRRDGKVVAAGDPTIPAFNTVPDLGGLKVTQIATGRGADGVVLEDGSIRVWGPAVPPGQPDLTGKKVISLDLGTNVAGAVTDDGVVHTWGSEAAVNAVPTSLNGQAVAKIAVGAKHAAVIIAFRALSEASISGIPQVGQTLTGIPAKYSLTPTTTTGQWCADDFPIKGQTGATLKVDGSLVGAAISYRTTATLHGVTRSLEASALDRVTRAGSATALVVSPAKGAAGKTRTATATVTRMGGTPTGTVIFTAGTNTRVVILDHGKATWTLPHLAAGRHAVTATYSGSPSADPSAAVPVKLRITKVASKVHTEAQATAKGVQIAVTVNTAAGVSPKGKVTVTLAGKMVTARVDAAGRATVTINKVRHGRYTAQVAYAGNESVFGSDGKVTFEV